MARYTWIIDRQKMYKISDKVINFITETMKNWNLELTGGKTLTEMNIQWGIFLGGALSPSFLSLQWRLHINEKEKNNHLVYMDDIKLFAKPTYSSSVPIRDVALRTHRKQWTKGSSGERGSGISALIVWHDDDDDIWRKRKLLEAKSCNQKSHQKEKNLVKNWDHSLNGQKRNPDKLIWAQESWWRCARINIRGTTKTDYLYKEKKEEDSQTLKRA